VASVTLAIQSVTLTVGKETKLLLWVERSSTSLEHTFYAKLLDAGTGAVLNQPIRLDVNGTIYNMEYENGVAERVLWLEVARYKVQATFDGTNPQTANATAKNPYGEPYAACTTIQYGFRPSSNSTMLTVEPQATLAMTATKTQEQMQAEAQQNGWMKPPEPRFDLFFPWFRLHFVGVYGGQDIIDIGVSPIPFADYFYVPQNHPLWSKVNEWFAKITFNIVSGVAAIEAALWALSHLGPIAFAAVLAGYYGYKFYSLFALNWNSVEALWISLISTIVSLEISIWTGILTLIPFVFLALVVGAAAVRSLSWGFLCKLITIPINLALLFMTITRLASLGAI